jgi:hypothetical protein
VRARVSWRTNWPAAPQWAQQRRRGRGRAWAGTWAETSLAAGAAVAPVTGEVGTIGEEGPAPRR